MNNQLVDRIRKSRYLNTGIIIIEIIILGFIALSYFCEKRKGLEALDMGLTASDFSSEYTDYDGGWNIDSGMVDIGEQESYEVLYGPFIYIPKGNYTLIVGYNCEEDQKIRPYSAGTGNDYIVANTINLDNNRNSISYSFKTTGPLDDFEIRAYYNGEGAFQINDIKLYRNLNGYKKTLFILVCLFILIDLCLIKKEDIKKHKKEIVILSGIIMIISLPLFMDGMVYPSWDTDFHLMRIEGLCNELRLGHIPVRIQSTWGNGNGYPVSVYYGDILLYFPAFLRLIGFSVSFAYAGYVLLINVITVAVSYYSFSIIAKDKDISLLMTAAYAASTYRLLTIYMACELGTYTAMSFLPLVAAAMFLLFSDEKKSPKPDVKIALMLAVAMTGIITSHSLSTVMCIEVLLILCILNIRKTLRSGTILTLVLSMVLTMAFSLYFIVPFMDYYLNVDVLISHDSDAIHHIQSGGVDLFQYLAFYLDPYTVGNPLTPGMLLIMGFVAAIMLLIFKGITDHSIKILTILSSVLLLVSTNLFPWDWIAEHSAIGNFLSQIQFSMRYLEFACITLTVLLGFLLVTVKGKTLIKDPLHFNGLLLLSGGIVLMGIAVFYGQMAEHANICNIIDGVEIPDSPGIGAEYVRVDEEGEPILYIRKGTESIDAQTETLFTKGYTMDIRIHTDEKPGVIMTPYTNYKGYKAYDQVGNSFDITDDKYCKATFTVPAHYDGIVEISFVEPWYWRLSEIISLVAWVGAMIYFISMRKKAGKK